MKLYTLLFSSVLFFTSCASNNQFLVIDPSSVDDAEKLEIDRGQCIQIAAQFNLSGETAGKAIAGAAIGSVAVAGVATAVAGAIFAPAIPFILAGGAAGGGLWGSKVSKDEKLIRDKVMGDCMRDRGYKVYTSS